MAYIHNTYKLSGIHTSTHTNIQAVMHAIHTPRGPIYAATYRHTHTHTYGRSYIRTGIYTFIHTYTYIHTSTYT